MKDLQKRSSISKLPKEKQLEAIKFISQIKPKDKK